MYYYLLWQEASVIFSNAEEILSINTKMLGKLQAKGEPIAKLARVFLEVGPSPQLLGMAKRVVDEPGKRCSCPACFRRLARRPRFPHVRPGTARNDSQGARPPRERVERAVGGRRSVGRPWVGAALSVRSLALFVCLFVFLRSFRP